ncbi:MAG: bacteriohemerythrin [Coriobacteriia bacterium]|nr:bacteriohemerythrin [Coriobacteriia bacterium]
MDTFEWTPDLETGNETIDTQHRTLFAYANDLDRAVGDAEMDDEATAGYVWRLTDYVMQHFADEQELMESVGYPELGIHVGLHDRLTGETMRLTARVMRGEVVAGAEIATLVSMWMRVHILDADRAFVKYLSTHR